MMNGAAAWSKQQPLAARWRLIVPTRRGFVPNPPAPVCDFDIDALDVVALLGDGAHLVGHSYGGLVALLAAGIRPDAVRSLTVVEPAAMSVARGNPVIEVAIRRHIESLAAAPDDPHAFLQGVTAALGGDADRIRKPLPPDVLQHVVLLMHERPPWEAELPLAALAAAPFPILVVSGGESGVQEIVCDALAAALGPVAERLVLPGAGHLVQRAGPPFNDRLEAFLRSAGSVAAPRES
jgi:pimeloyl-ACP methyl ester carboxylesterase